MTIKWYLGRTQTNGLKPFQAAKTCYIGGVYDWNESECFTLREYGTKAKAKAAAIAYAQKQIERLS